jgi:SAM-dependent methyltransferase
MVHSKEKWDQRWQKKAQEASNRNLALNLLQMDLEATASLPQGPFDVISKFFYLQRSLLPIIKEILKPGGIAILRSFGKTKDATTESGNPDIILNPGELLEVFAEWDILLYEEGLEESRAGGTLTGIVARKPKGPARKS